MKKALTIFALIFGCVYSLQDGGLDWVVDVILDNVREAMVENKVSTVGVPSFDKNFTEKFMGVEFTAVVSAKEGYLKNISTVVRTSRAKIYSGGADNFVNIVSDFGLTDLEITYSQFDAYAWGSKSSGPMSAKCSSDSFTLNVTSSWDWFGACKTTVNSANLKTLGTCSVDMGKGPMNWFRGYLFTFLLNHYDMNIVESVNAQILAAVRKNLEPVNLCKYFGGNKTVVKH